MPIFVLHKVAAPARGARDPFDYIEPAKLESKLAALGAAGLAATTLDAAREPAPGRFVLTFDDGYTNVIRNGLEILVRQKAAAIQFLVAGRLGGHNDWDVAKGEVREALMDHEQVREWLAAGQQIGSHGLTHSNLKRLSLSAAREEIAASKKLLEDRFGVPIRHFSYPSGKFTPQVQELVREAGYETACGVEFGINGRAEPRFALHRIAPLYAGELMAKAFHRLRRRLAEGSAPARASSRKD